MSPRETTAGHAMRMRGDRQSGMHGRACGHEATCYMRHTRPTRAPTVHSQSPRSRTLTCRRFDFHLARIRPGAPLTPALSESWDSPPPHVRCLHRCMPLTSVMLAPVLERHKNHKLNRRVLRSFNGLGAWLVPRHSVCPCTPVVCNMSCRGATGRPPMTRHALPRPACNARIG